VYERLLIKPSQIERLILAPTLEDASTILTECGYHGNAEDELARTIEKLKELCPDKKLLEGILAEYALHNARVLAKGLGEEALYPFAENSTTAKPVELKYNSNATPFDLDYLTNWFIMKKREIRIVKTILTLKKLGVAHAKIRELVGGIQCLPL